MVLAEVVRGADQVGHVGGECRVGEVAVGVSLLQVKQCAKIA